MYRKYFAGVSLEFVVEFFVSRKIFIMSEKIIYSSGTYDYFLNK